MLMNVSLCRLAASAPFTLLVAVVCQQTVCGFSQRSTDSSVTGVPRYDQAVARGIGYLKSRQVQAAADAGRRSLVGYALLKAGESPASPVVRRAIAAALGKVTTASYRPVNSDQHIYEAGVDAMLLADSDPQRHRDAIQAIANYLVQQQAADGSWDYPRREVGDTSMAQYATLGLWAASRSDVDVPLRVWDKCALWHIRTQRPDGGFAYHPGRVSSPGTGSGNSTHNMTAGATGSLAIVRLMLYPNAGQPGRPRARTPRKFGVLESVEIPSTHAAQTDGFTTRHASEYIPDAGRAAIDEAIKRGINWLTTRFQPTSPLTYKLYYNYALERTCALNGLDMLGRIDWYARCGNELLTLQQDNGKWDSGTTDDVATSFAILFYIRTTGRLLGRQYGTGLLASGRGLPDNLAMGFDPNAPPEKKAQNTGPLNQLLAELERADFTRLDGVSRAVVENIRFGDREKLIGQIDRLRMLANHPHAEVRRTALWGLGRSGNVRIVPLLLDGLRDNDVDVMVEARNALCTVSRKSRGFGFPVNPLQAASDMSDEARARAADEWREKVLDRWNSWWFRVRPWDLRDDLPEALSTSSGL